MTPRATVLVLFIALHLAGCGPKTGVDIPTIDEFVGEVTSNGQRISFPEGDQVIIRLTHLKSAQRYGIPVSSDGTFDIGWMPIGKYSVTLETKLTRKSRSSASMRKDTAVAAEFEIADGQTQYTLELGDAWKNSKK